ncbi:glutaredoxin family protein [Brachybacterium sp. AOP25-B2-12]|uniref:glutaredoxin family protein n=1 Tax=Brachybacterium sp. AOP25-B2-12 TaxID=3457710 RepID=UPI004034541E
MVAAPGPAPAPPAASDPSARIVLLDRDGCHLCEAARPLVADEAERAGTTVERLDVDADPDLREAWGDQVPVVVVDGQVVARYRVDPVALRRALRPGPRWRRLLPGG